jgi:pyridinium-3,5-bisthiocarboxylic acid mononucleotide nickel chelatase
MITSKKILMIDCQGSGVAGDMILGALIDLGANVDNIVSAIKSLENPENGYKNIKIKINPVLRAGFKATQISVTSESAPKMRGGELIGIIENAAGNIGLSPKAKQFVSKVIYTLVGAEAELHKASFNDTHLHEVALIDTAAEIIGCAIALDNFGLFDSKIYSTPVAVGGGMFKFSHGTVSSPAPATLAILQSKNFPFIGGPIESELATPTGVSILVNLVDKITRFYPAMVPIKSGYGAGTIDFAEIPALLRLTIGQSIENELAMDQIAVLETNIDDVAAEVLGYTLDKLLSEGAKDVSIIPMYTKKNRPGHIIKVIADQNDVEHLSQVLIDETGTLGARVYYCERHILNRELHTVNLQLMGNQETIRIKVSKNLKGEIIHVKPEYEDLKKLAEKTKKPLRELSEIAISKAREVLK